jgi:uncharacterized membrane protein (DUF373 family)
MVAMKEPRTATGPAGSGTSERTPKYTRLGNRLLEISEDIVYVGIAAMLLVTAMVLLVVAAIELVTLVRERSQEPALAVLDTLLLVFIVVELLFTVRATLAQRQLVAEPFLLVGIIASIKEIVVLSVKAADDAGRGQAFTDQLLEIGVLGALVLSLGITAWLLRLKEREPEEGDDAPDTADVRD